LHAYFRSISPGAAHSPGAARRCQLVPLRLLLR
jgi:hypothetical protein